jgi:hypothetical protein
VEEKKENYLWESRQTEGSTHRRSSTASNVCRGQGDDTAIALGGIERATRVRSGGDKDGFAHRRSRSPVMAFGISTPTSAKPW